MTRGDDWPPEATERLREMWLAGDAARAIATALGTSKNAVVGKAHRLHLPGRLNPAKRPTSGDSPPVRTPRPPEASGASDLVAPAAAPATRAAPLPGRGRSEPCAWVVTMGGGRMPVYCEAPSEAGRPYCPQHAKGLFTRAAWHLPERALQGKEPI